MAAEIQMIGNEAETVEFNFSLCDGCATPWPCRLFDVAEEDVCATDFGKFLAHTLGKVVCATNTEVRFTCFGARGSIVISVRSQSTYTAACILVQSMFEFPSISGLFWPQFLFVDNMNALCKTAIQEHKRRLSFCYNNDHFGGLAWRLR